MNSLLCFTVVLFAAFCSLQVDANPDPIEQGCQFIRQNPDLIDNMVACETENYPPRFNEISRNCLQQATGMDKASHIRATCTNIDNLNRAMPRIQRCVMENQQEILGMISGIAEGIQKSQQCIRDLVTSRLSSGRSRRSVLETAQASETAKAVLNIDTVI